MDDNPSGVCIIDFGSETTRCGRACERTPSLIFPTVFGSQSGGCGPTWYYAGQDAIDTLEHCVRHEYGFKVPFNNCHFENCGGLDVLIGLACGGSGTTTSAKIYQGDDLGMDGRSHPVVITEAAVKEKRPRERTKILESLFEGIGRHWCSGVAFGDTSVLSLVGAKGCTTGLVVDVGKSMMRVTPVIEGVMVHDTSGEVDIGGEEITCYLSKILSERGYEFDYRSRSDRAIVEDIKKKYCFVAEEYEQCLMERDYMKEGVQHEPSD